MLPSFVTMIKVFPDLAVCEQACEKNKQEWTKLFDEYEKEKELGNSNYHTKIIEQWLPQPV